MKTARNKAIGRFTRRSRHRPHSLHRKVAKTARRLSRIIRRLGRPLTHLTLGWSNGRIPRGDSIVQSPYHTFSLERFP